MMTSNLFYLCPELILTFMGCLILITAPVLSRISRWLPYLLCQVTLLLVFGFTLNLAGHPKLFLFNNSFVLDNIGSAVKMVIAIYAIFSFIYARKYVWERGILGIEYFVLCLFSILGMNILISAGSFITLYLGLELLALPLYALIAMGTEDRKAPEAAMKYFVMGAIASGMFLYGVSLLYGVTGSIELVHIATHLSMQAAEPNISVLLGMVFIIIGLAFKLGAVPFHMWVPDIYQGALTSVTLFIGTLPKLAGFALAIRLLRDSFSDLAAEWQSLLMIMALLSLAIGNIVAIAQANLKRMLAYSTIAHVGFLLLGLLAGPEAGYSAAFFYVVIYSLTALGTFAVIIALSHQGFEAENILDFQGLAKSQPWIAFLMLILLLSLAGIPPTLGFYAKFAVLAALIEAGFTWAAVAAVLFSVIGAFYYLRVIRVMFFEPRSEGLVPLHSIPRAETVLLSFNGLLVLVLGIYPAPVLNWSRLLFP